jgi:hypothetical protein
LSKMIEVAVEIVLEFGGEFDPSHSYRASFLAVGRRGFLPAARLAR